MAQSTKFWDKIADKYSKQPIADEAAYQKKLAVARDYFRPDMEVLEIGCDTGSTAILHAPYVKHIRAIDFSTNMIAIAQGKAEAENIHNVTFEQATIEDLAIPDQSLDAVLGLSILHLLEDKEGTMASGLPSVISWVYQMLKPGGIFVTSTVCIGDTMGWFKLIAPIGRFLGFFPFVAVLTTQALADSLTQAGFELDYQWQPSKGKAVFIVAQKPA
ncbi:class I SAM-dependent methyltransferase [Acaryochloris sp. CCMEE 5410]|uniref:class I SAM-dependent methyltransferase n=1 Tax=Acaryochloris sp. CCMEE 5410 TaxID=310037 RepID=UPI0002483D97|nr:class I SAM-dependent methyltransferase [Acaryochloris sp. CCMEE 5410]KAI9134744.1 class I SAM-dependent methyltransferase [Acaryochloris sp. CCMEE 5410]